MPLSVPRLVASLCLFLAHTLSLSLYLSIYVSLSLSPLPRRMGYILRQALKEAGAGELALLGQVTLG